MEIAEEAPARRTPPGPASVHDRAAEVIAPERLRRATAHSIGWTMVRIGAEQLFSFLIFVALARMLPPSQFGLFALALLVIEIGRIISSGGLTQAIARAPSVSEELADTVFWSNLGLAIILALAGFAAADELALAVGDPAVAGPLRALCAVLPIAALGATHMTLRLRQFGHRSMAVRAIVGGVVSGVAALAAAWYGWGLWSLVVQKAVQELIGAILSWTAYRWRPGLLFSWVELSAIRGFAVDSMISQLTFFALVRVQDVVIGRVIGAGAVGIYRTAWRMIELISVGTIQPFSGVSVQTLARLQSDLPAFRRAYLRLNSTSALAAFPAIIGFGVLAPVAVPFLFGPQWVEAGPICQIFALMVVPFTLNIFAAPALFALGQSRAMRWVALLQFVLTLGLSLAVAHLGLAAIAMAYVARAYLTLPVQILLLRRHAGMSIRSLGRAILPPLIASLAMAAALLALWSSVRALLPHDALWLAAMVAAGAAVYGVSILMLDRDARVMAVSLLRRAGLFR
jgi:O-antigen/teichoic acid export membrane protein